MELEPDFEFRPLPLIQRPLVFQHTVAGSPLGPLAELKGKWSGKGCVFRRS